MTLSVFGTLGSTLYPQMSRVHTIDRPQQPDRVRRICRVHSAAERGRVTTGVQDSVTQHEILATKLRGRTSLPVFEGVTLGLGHTAGRGCVGSSTERCSESSEGASPA